MDHTKDVCHDHPSTLTNSTSDNAKILEEWFHQSSTSLHSPELPRILILDGGVSTHLETILQQQQSTGTEKTKKSVFPHRELWSSSLLLSSSGKNAIQTCHEHFYNAGADIVSTVTYQCHYLVCQPPQDKNKKDELYLSVDTVDNMLRDGVRLAREAAKNVSSSLLSSGSRRKLFVAASIGCYGAALADGSEYRGNYGLTKEQLYKFHEKKVSILLAQSPDILAFETIPSIDECIAIMELLQTLHRNNKSDNTEKKTKLPATWLSMACSDGMCLNDGFKVEDILMIIDEMDPDATVLNGIGINCCSFVHVIPLVQLIVQNMIRSEIKRALIFYPNSGEEWDASNEAWVQGTGCTNPTEFASVLSKSISTVDEMWSNAISSGKIGGESCGKIPIIVGGCCRTDPATISAIRDMVGQHQTD